jgi:hypothetical protein
MVGYSVPGSGLVDVACQLCSPRRFGTLLVRLGVRWGWPAG